MGLGDKIKHAADGLLHGHGTPKPGDLEQGRDPSEFPEAEPFGARQPDPDSPIDDPDVDPDSDEPPVRDPDLDPDEPPLDDPYDPDEAEVGGSFTGPLPDDPIERLASPREDKPPAL